MLPKQPNKSLIDGMNCLQSIISSGRPVGVRELGREMDLDPTRVHRLVKTLAHLGLTQQDSRGKYAAGPGIHALAAQSLYASHFLQIAIDPLEKLKNEIKHTVAMGVLWKKVVSYFYHSRSGSPLSKAVGSFGVWDAAESGIGLATLSALEDSEIQELFKDHEMPYYEDGFAGLMKKIDHARQYGYVIGNNNPKNHHRTIAKLLDYNPSVAVAISGEFSDEAIPELVSLLTDSVEEINQSALHNKTSPIENISNVKI